MRVVIAGGSGLLGQALAGHLVEQHQEVVVLTRRAGPSRHGYREVEWHPDGTAGTWAREVDGADVVVNLAGNGIADRRWTAERKKSLRASRIDSTRSLIAAVRSAQSRPATFVQASAVGIYGTSLDDRTFDERSAPGTDFLSQLAVDWEHEAKPAEEIGCRLVVIRTGLVLSNRGGALPPMARPFRMFVGGPIGTGRQYLSWITIDDWVSMVAWAISKADVSGPLNATAPHPVTNADFSAALARALSRPNLLPVPSFALRALFGEMADAILLKGQRVVPAKAVSHGFAFANADLDQALRHVLRS